jgi:prevent-host-death family protein
VQIVDRTVTVHEAKSNLSRLIADAERGQNIGISRGQGEAVVIITAAPRRDQRQMGWMTGLVIPPDFNTMGRDEIVTIFEGVDE